MENMKSTAEPGADWSLLQPVLDHAMHEINEGDRDAIRLRYFERLSLAEVGVRLGVTENTAAKRIERALEKLRARFTQRGITSTSVALAAVLEGQTTVAAPAGLAASVTGAALAGTAAGAGGWVATFMTISKLQVAIASAVAASFATAYVLQGRTNAALRGEIAAFQGQQASVAALQAENKRLEDTAAEVEILRHDDVELARLSQDVAQAQRAQKEAVRLAGVRGSEINAQAEVDRMNREGSALVAEYKILKARAGDASVSAEDKADAETAAKQKFAAIQAKQREMQQFIGSARAADPSFNPAGTGTLTLSSSPARSDGRATGTFSFRPVPASGEGGPVGRASNTGGVSIRLPQADLPTALATYAQIAGVMVVREPSIAGIRGGFDFQVTSASRAEAAQALQTALREQLNVVLETAPDGTVVAKVGPAR